MLPKPDDPLAPKFWRDESSGRLAPAIERYLAGVPLQLADVSLIKAYLHQWIESPVWNLNPTLDAQGVRELARLREAVGRIQNVADISQWIHAALDQGIDPL